MRTLLVLATLAMSATSAAAQGPGRPIIDMHLHAYPVDFAAGLPICPGDAGSVLLAVDPREEFDPSSVATSCDAPMTAPLTDEALRTDTISEMRRLNIRRAVTSGPLTDAWRAAAPDMILPSSDFSRTDVSPEDFRIMHGDGRLFAFSEVLIQYRGLSVDDARYEPYFVLAEELDIPVGVHLGEGPPGAARFPGYGSYRVRLTSPFQLEEVLQRHPRLRIYVAHYASPLVDEMIAMMFAYPNLHVDISCNNWAFPRAQFHDQLRRMVEAGFERRIMWGSDQMVWPGALAEAVEAIETAPFLNETQRRAIFYDNAARFLRLTPEQIAADHAT